MTSDENRQENDTADIDPHKSGAGCFEIHVKGHLSRLWWDWLEGLDVKLLDNGEMVLSGPIIDQAALMGILNKLDRLNLTLLSVMEINRKENNK